MKNQCSKFYVPHFLIFVLQMGFLRTNKDGTTSLAILCGNSGVLPGTNEQPVTLGSLAGKIPQGTGQLAGFREDKRNYAKLGL